MSELLQWIVLSLACATLLFTAISLIAGRLIIGSLFGDRDSIDLHQEFLSLPTDAQTPSSSDEQNDPIGDEVTLWRELVDKHRSGQEATAARNWRSHLDQKNDSRIA